jgi:hypothetical protein
MIVPVLTPDEGSKGSRLIPQGFQELEETFELNQVCHASRRLLYVVIIAVFVVAVGAAML